MDVLTVEHLTKKIGNKTILEDVSLNLKRGQIIGLVGANGAGKTSLMKVILGYSSYQDGTFRICLLYTSPSPRDKRQSRMPSSA